uniref:Zinc finger protein 354B n=1 Tax=Rousettus aegyptiacus TaxID=9407 RepID=A0A7J8FP32_ROUAE|nr:zinc finger protein 354B [Rousettus aegyptiacus]
MLENYGHLVSLGLPLFKPKVISLLQQGEEPWKVEEGSPGCSWLGEWGTEVQELPQAKVWSMSARNVVAGGRVLVRKVSPKFLVLRK